VVLWSVVGQEGLEFLGAVDADGVGVLAELVEVDLLGAAVGLDLLVVHGPLLQLLQQRPVVLQVLLADAGGQGEPQLLVAQQVDLGIEAV